MKPPITAPTLVILGLIGLGLLTVVVRHQERRSEGAHRVRHAVVGDAGRVSVELCNGESYVVERDVVYFPDATRVPTYTEYERAAASCERAARQLRWEGRAELKERCPDED